MKIPVFVSCPTLLSDGQAAAHELMVAQLEALELEPRALGRSDYPDELPLREVLTIARHCSGGVILGFTQTWLKTGTGKPGTADEKRVSDLPLPSPWNHLEAGILFGLHLPLLVFCESKVSGGIFDRGVTDAFIHKMPDPDAPLDPSLRSVLLKWSGRVRQHYYRI